MQFTQRQYMFIGLFAVFWTAFMLFWNGDYRPVRIAILFAVGVVIAFVWGWSMKRWGNWKDQS